MRRYKKQAVIQATIDKFLHLKRQFPLVASLFSSLSAIGELAIFGGVIRDLVIFGNQESFRDIDIVVCVSNDDDLGWVFQKVPFRRTRFGGFHCMLEGVCLDVWALGATWAFKEGLLKTHIENLPRSAFLSIDAIVVTLADRELYEYRFFESIDEKTIDIVLEKNPFPALCVLRSFVLRRKYEFHFSEALQTYIRNFWERAQNPLGVLDETQLSHYGGRVISGGEIRNDMERYVI